MLHTKDSQKTQQLDGGSLNPLEYVFTLVLRLEALRTIKGKKTCFRPPSFMVLEQKAETLIFFSDFFTDLQRLIHDIQRLEEDLMTVSSSS